MELLKKILSQDTVRSWKVRSKSEKGKFHLVKLKADGELVCGEKVENDPSIIECVAGSYGKFCRHKKLVAVKLMEKGIKVKIPENGKRD